MSESETATAVAPASPDLASLSPADLQTWRQTGDVPASKTSDSSDVPEDSSSSQPDGQAAEIAASTPAASEPATPKKANAETRKAELNAEIQALLRQRDEIRASLSSAARPTAPPDVSTADPSPATQPVSLESVISHPDVTQPILTEEQFYTQFPEASVGAFVRYAARYEYRLAAVEQQQAQTISQRRADFAARASTIDPDVLQKLPVPFRNAAPTGLLQPGEQAGVWNVAVEEILHAQDTAGLIAHLADHPDDVQRIAATNDPTETIRTIAQIEARLGSPSVPSKPVVKATTSAPPPPPTLGSKPALPADDVEEALATGDVGKYIRVMNARELAGKL